MNWTHSLCILICLPLGTFAQSPSDTLIKGKRFAHVKYDLNQQAIEIGERYENGTRNGEWMFYDQQGRLEMHGHYRNDTLHGSAEAYAHFDAQPSVRISGQVIQGKRQGPWRSDLKRRLWGWKPDAIYHYDATGKVAYSALLWSRHKVKTEIWYDDMESPIYYKNWTKCRKLSYEGSGEDRIVLPE